MFNQLNDINVNSYTNFYGTGDLLGVDFIDFFTGCPIMDGWSLEKILTISFFLSAIGLTNLFFCRNNILLMLLNFELVMTVNVINLAVMATYLNDIKGFSYSLILLGLIGAETCISFILLILLLKVDSKLNIRFFGKK